MSLQLLSYGLQLGVLMNKLFLNLSSLSPQPFFVWEKLLSPLDSVQAGSQTFIPYAGTFSQVHCQPQHPHKLFLMTESSSLPKKKLLKFWHLLDFVIFPCTWVQCLFVVSKLHSHYPVTCYQGGINFRTLSQADKIYFSTPSKVFSLPCPQACIQEECVPRNLKFWHKLIASVRHL